MGNSQGAGDLSPPITREYEDTIEILKASLPLSNAISYERCQTYNKPLTFPLRRIATPTVSRATALRRDMTKSTGRRRDKSNGVRNTSSPSSLTATKPYGVTHAAYSDRTNAADESTRKHQHLTDKHVHSNDQVISNGMVPPTVTTTATTDNLCDNNELQEEEDYSNLHSANLGKAVVDMELEPLQQPPDSALTPTENSCSPMNNSEIGHGPRLKDLTSTNESNNSVNKTSEDTRGEQFSVVGNRTLFDNKSNKLPSLANTVSIPVYGHFQNHKPFLEPQILPHFLAFILDSSLPNCLAACPHWFITLYSYLRQLCRPIVDSFISTYGEMYLAYDTDTFSIQPLFTAESSVVRIDLLIYAKVLPACQNRCTQFGYAFQYQSTHQPGPPSCQSLTADGTLSPRSSDPLASSRLIADTSSATLRSQEKVNQQSFFESQATILPPKSSSYDNTCPREYQSLFRFEARRKHSRRDIWFQKDMCQFHGDELMIATHANVPTVNVDDWLEIPITLSNAFGLVELKTIRWLPPTFIMSPAARDYGQLCEIDCHNQNWVSLDLFQPTTNERLQIHDHFSPSWKHLKTEFTGIDITYSRSFYVATEVGEVSQCKQWLGHDAVVKPPRCPIVCSLTRLGLQHDRFTCQQLRQGDYITVYMSQGGGVLN